MSNSYLMFCSAVRNITAEEEQFLDEQLEVVPSPEGYEWDDELPRFLAESKEFLAEDNHYWADIDVEDIDGSKALVISAAENGTPYYACLVVQKLFKKYRPAEKWMLAYACTTDKQLVDGFGGGVVVVSAEEVIWFDDHEIFDIWKRGGIDRG